MTVSLDSPAAMLTEALKKENDQSQHHVLILLRRPIANTFVTPPSGNLEQVDGELITIHQPDAISPQLLSPSARDFELVITYHNRHSVGGV